MSKVILAQQIGIGSSGPITTISGPLEGINSLGDLVNKVMDFLIPLASIILLVVLIWGGIDYLMSKGEPAGLKAGKAKITAGIIGFILLATSYILVKVLAYILNLQGGMF